MADSFEPGEIAIFQPVMLGLLQGKCGPGSECEVLARADYDLGGDTWYWCLFPDDPCPYSGEYSGAWQVREIELRKKKPPQEEESWAAKQYLTNWQPDKSMRPVSYQSHTSSILEADHG